MGTSVDNHQKTARKYTEVDLAGIPRTHGVNREGLVVGKGCGEGVPLLTGEQSVEELGALPRKK